MEGLKAKRWSNSKEVVKMKYVALFVILFILIIFGCATQKTEQIPPGAQKICDAPVWNEGDTWKFIGAGDREWEENIIVKNGKQQIKQTPKKEFYGFALGGLEMQRFFPLWIGKSWAGAPSLQTVWGGQLNYIVSLKVVDSVSVQVEAGTFDCYKFEFRIFFGTEDGIAYFYYSKETKSIVKFETRSEMLYKSENYELLSFRHSK